MTVNSESNELDNRGLSRWEVAVRLGLGICLCVLSSVLVEWISMGDDIDNVINGSEEEGGGQVLRVSMSLATVLHESLRVFNIRGGRPQPGLRPQHMMGLELIKKLSSPSTINGLLKGSTSIDYWPGEMIGGHHKTLCPTAGSATLILQGAFPCALYSPCKSEFFIRGGTNVPFSPPIEYTRDVFLPLARKMGVNASLDIHRRGYNPEGGGEITVQIEPLKHLDPFILTEAGPLKRLWGEIYVFNKAPRHIIDEIVKGAESVLKKFRPGYHIDWQIERPKHSATFGVSVFAETANTVLGASRIFPNRDDPFKFGQEAAEELAQDIKKGVCVDSHAQDQLIILAALANGVSKFRTGAVTTHTTTAISVCQKFTKAVFKIEQDPHTNTNIIQCVGIGHTNKYV